MKRGVCRMRRGAVLGTDFPYEAGDVFVRAIKYITDPQINEHEANAILESNATALFGITTA
jgi:hypothetical protein